MNAQDLKSESFDTNQRLKSENQNRIFASPLAKRLAKDLGVDLNSVRGTGPHGRIVRSDIENLETGESELGSEILSLNKPSISPLLPTTFPIQGE